MQTTVGNNEPPESIKVLKAKANAELLRNALCLLRILLSISSDMIKFGQWGRWYALSCCLWCDPVGNLREEGCKSSHV